MTPEGKTSFGKGSEGQEFSVRYLYTSEQELAILTRVLTMQVGSTLVIQSLGKVTSESASMGEVQTV